MVYVFEHFIRTKVLIYRCYVDVVDNEVIHGADS